MLARLALAAQAGLAIAAALAVGSTLAACTPQNNALTLRDGDAAYYATEVQPLVGRDCAFEGCHGREGMPLTLYAVDYLRLRDPEGLVDTSGPSFDERALSDAELEHDRRAIAARTSRADPQGDALILRLVPVDQGGIPHAGVAVYPRIDYPDVTVLRTFLGTVHED